jgi:AraC family transcriptional regulator of adaptative response/methylated-DNA-[protein]-cysteine methyltransferase
MTKKMYSTSIQTPLGRMLAIADEQSLYFLEFEERQGFRQSLARLQKKTGAVIVSGSTKILVSIERELHDFFKGTLKVFNTPLSYLGTPFQKQVWSELQKIPFGETCSYLSLAAAVGRPTAVRAVAQANASNQLAVIIPCHRVINANGALGGYAGGLHKKQWLLDHEKN